MVSVVTLERRLYKTSKKYSPNKLYKASGVSGLRRVGQLVWLWFEYRHGTSIAMVRIIEVIPDGKNCFDELKCLIVEEKNHIA